MKKQIVTIFTLLVFFSGTATAQQQQSYENDQPQAKSNKNENITNTGKVKSITRITLNDKFNGFDAQVDFKLGAFYYGVSSSSSFTVPTVSGIYVYGKYCYPLSDKFNIWGSAGYALTRISDYTFNSGFGNVTIPSSTGGAITWQVGADIFMSEKFGVTAYSYELESFNIGVVFRSK